MLFYRLKRRFGKRYAPILFLKLKFNLLQNIKLPGIKNRISMREGTSDLETFIQIFLDREYNIDIKFDPAFIIDGGANIGLFSIYMKKRFPKSKIISIEPDPDNFKLLQKNVDGYSNIFCENFGLWNKQTNLKITDKFGLGKWAMVVEETEGKGEATANTIHDIMETYSINRIDILKLDIESSEKILFQSNYEAWLPKTKMIIIELHDWMEEGCSRTFFTAINSTFKSYTYLIKGENTIIINNDID